MKLLDCITLLALTVGATQAEVVACFTGGQPFDCDGQGCLTDKISNVCDHFKDQNFGPGETKTQCLPMKDDRIFFAVHNVGAGGRRPSLESCVNSMVQAATCGADPQHGGVFKDHGFRFR